MKYRIVQKADKYNPQCRRFLFWYKVRNYSDDINWMSARAACDMISYWKKLDKFNASPVNIHSPEDICKGG